LRPEFNLISRGAPPGPRSAAQLVPWLEPQASFVPPATARAGTAQAHRPCQKRRPVLRSN